MTAVKRLAETPGFAAQSSGLLDGDSPCSSVVAAAADMSGIEEAASPYLLSPALPVSSVPWHRSLRNTSHAGHYTANCGLTSMFTE